MLLGCKSIAIIFPFQSLCLSSLCLLPSLCFEKEKDAHSFYFSLSTYFLAVFNKVRRLLLRKRKLFSLLSRNKDASKKEEYAPSYHFISLYFDLFLALIFPHQHHRLQRFNHLFKLISGRFNSSQTSNCREMTEPFIATFIPAKFQVVRCSL